MVSAPVVHTWANIVASATTSIDVPGISDAVNMDTDRGSQLAGEMMSSAVSEGQGEPVTASLGGLETPSNAPPSHTTATYNKVCGTPTP